MSRLPSPDSHNSLSEIPGTLQYFPRPSVRAAQVPQQEAEAAGSEELLPHSF